MKIEWIKLDDSWLAKRSDGAEGWAGRKQDDFWYGSVVRIPIGRDGACFSGGGEFFSLPDAKRAVMQALRR